MAELKYNLFENAIDSIKHGIEHFLGAQKDPKTEGRHYKYSILHAIQGAELFLKERLLRINVILIYSNIDKPISEGSITADFKSLPQRLMNSGVSIKKKWLSTIEEGRKVRNRIEHKDVSFSLKETRWLLGRTFRFLIEFAREELKTELKNHLTDSEYDELIRQSGFFEEIYAHAESKALDLAKKLKTKGITTEIEFCPECEAHTIVIGINEGEESLHTKVCPMCKYRIYLVKCIQCGRTRLSTSPPDWYNFCDARCHLEYLDE